MQTTVTPFFTPTQISGCQLWLDAADTATLTLSGTNVTQWNDKSGNRNNAQTTLGTPVLQSLNGIQGIYFATETEQMTTVSNAATLGSAARTMLCVIRAPSASSEVLIGCGNHTVGASPTSFGFHLEGPNSRLFAPYTYSTDNNIISFFSTAGMIVYADYNPSVNTVAGSYNGTSLQSRSTATLATTTSPWYLGRRPDNNGCVTGYIYEVVHYSSVLSTAQRQQVEGYLAWKWGLQANLPANHPYKNSPIPPLLNPPTTLPVALPGAWQPTQIPGCSLWLDSADQASLTLSGNNVTRWNDKSGRGYSVSQSTLANQPTRTSQTSGIRFEGQRYLSQTSGNVPILRDLTTMTILCVVANTASVAYNNIVTFWYKDAAVTYSTTPKFNLYTSFNSTNTVVFQCAVGAGSSSVSNPTALTNNTATLVGCSASPSAITANYNGTISSASGLSLQIASADTLLTIGYPGYESNLIYEILVYNSSVSTQERQQAEGYLAWKWGLQGNLPANHPYKNTPPSITNLPIYPRSIVTSASWQPTRISGCSLWLDAADSATVQVISGSVNLWLDKSGNGRNATGSLSPTLVQGIQNKLPAIYFNGASYLTGSLTNTTAQQSFFSVFRYNTGAPQYARLASFGVNGQFDYNNNAYYNMSYNTGTLAITRSPTETQVTLATPALDAFHQASVIFTGTNGLYYTDGGTNTNSAAWTANFNISQYRLGTDQIVFVPQQMIGYIAEVIVYSGGVTTVQRQQVEGYLAWKWGLVGSLPANHPWKRWPPSP